MEGRKISLNWHVRVWQLCAIALVLTAGVMLGPQAAFGHAARADASVPASHTARTEALPEWFHWGNTSDHHNGHPCIVAWGGNGASKAEICSDGFAVVARGISASPAVACTHNYKSTVHVGGFPNWSEVQWTSNSCDLVFRGVSQCYGGKPTQHKTEVGGWVVRTGLPTRATCPASEPTINRAGYDTQTATGGSFRTWYWPSSIQESRKS